jgi:tetraacyldisaccharide 4'-kinase
MIWMIDPAEYREFVSGRRKGYRASAVRGLLRVAEAPYTLAVSWRNRRYDRERAAIRRVGVPVVSVGNLTLGGTGKTPLVKWIARWFRNRGISVAIVSRGYRSRAEAGDSDAGYNDEALELQQSLPGVPHMQDPNRVAGAMRAVAEHLCEAVLLDDGFQHRRLARDLDIVLLDALEPFGFDHVFPRGTLREPVGELRRAQVVCLSRADAISDSERDVIRRRVAALAPNAAWCEATHAASGLMNAGGELRPLHELAGRRVAAFCGIGNPAGFRHTLDSTGCHIALWRVFPDHHAYTPENMASLGELAAASQAELAICTHKDLVKIRDAQIAGKPLWAVAIEIEFLRGQDAMEKALRAVLRAR